MSSTRRVMKGPVGAHYPPNADVSTETAKRSRQLHRLTVWPSGRSVRVTCPKTNAFQVADLRRDGVSVAKIAEQFNRAPSTIYRELKRNASSSGVYRPHEAHRQAVGRRARHHRRRIDTHPEQFDVISELLMQRWSPEQISRHL